MKGSAMRIRSAVRTACVLMAMGVSTAVATGQASRGGAGVTHRSSEASGARMKEIKRFAVPDGPKSLRFTPDGKYVVVCCLYGHKVAVIDSETFQTVHI